MKLEWDLHVFRSRKPLAQVEIMSKTRNKAKNITNFPIDASRKFEKKSHFINHLVTNKFVPITKDTSDTSVYKLLQRKKSSLKH